MRRRLTIEARDLCNVAPYRPFTILVVKWTKTAMTLSKNMIPAHSTASPNTLGPTGHK